MLIVDRYSASGVAYGAASGLDMELCISKEQGKLKPELAIFLDIPIAVAMTSGGFGKEKFETVAFQKAVAIAYTQIQDHTWVTVNTAQSEAAITKKVLYHVMNFLSIMAITKYGDSPSD